MNLLDALILGLVQGLTEFLPVSSSGHLVMAETFLDVPSAGIFVEVALHVATLLSVVIVYRARLAELALGTLRRDPDALRYMALLALATVPAAVVGLTLKDLVERAFATPALTGFMLLFTGAFLWSTRYVQRPVVDEPAGPKVALAMGFAQALALLPGISRSGATITAGLWGRASGVRAAEFSFLMSIPAIIGAAILEARNFEGAVSDVGGAPLLVAFFAALAAGILAIRSLVWLLRRQSFYAFAYYVWAAGALFLLLLWLRG